MLSVTCRYNWLLQTLKIPAKHLLFPIWLNKAATHCWLLFTRGHRAEPGSSVPGGNQRAWGRESRRLWGASQHGFEVERLKRKDLSKWDDGDTAGRRRRISTRDGEACEYWTPGPPRDIIKKKACYFWVLFSFFFQAGLQKHDTKGTIVAAFPSSRLHYRVPGLLEIWPRSPLSPPSPSPCKTTTRALTQLAAVLCHEKSVKVFQRNVCLKANWRSLNSVTGRRSTNSR